MMTKHWWAVLAILGAGCGGFGKNDADEDKDPPPPSPLVLSKQLEDSKNFNAMFFLDAQHGWIGGGEGAVYHPIAEGGWEKTDALTETGRDITALFFLDEQHGFAGTTAWNGAIIVETTNGGLTWSELATNVADADITRLFFLDADRGFALTKAPSGLLLRTLDGGRTWTQVAATVEYRSLHDLARAPDGTLWVTGFRLQSSVPILMKSSDDGVTWETNDSVGEQSLFDVDAPAANELWTTAFGSIGHSTDNGATWSTLDPDTDRHTPIAAVAFADAKRGIAVRGNSTTLYATNNGGTSWTLQTGAGGDIKQIFHDVWVGPDLKGFILSADDRGNHGVLYGFQLQL